ncbi:NAD(P)/FAD-dependent oxidoreductase [Kribbia dieselivorans]|uniref:NAD(P)/FAD-dependent oxidoreductase n=1 Tax=Kribbia dieselivorans TaxID=331526 RepID=UPI000A8E5B0D|nr:NAD(P)/FAD-dependent oxidoreductase [Kribbia dieselivorans]
MTAVGNEASGSPDAGEVVDVDVAIVGAGPTGLFGAYYAGMRSLSVALIDSLEEPGGQVSAMYPEKLIHDVAGFPSISGRNLVDNLVTQAAAADPIYLLGQEAQDLTRLDPAERGVGESALPRHFIITTSAGTQVRTGAIVVTGGIGTFTPRPHPAGEEFLHRGFSFFVPDPTPFAGADVVVVGGGDSAVDWALMLEPIAKSVTLVHRRAKFRAHPASLARLQASSATIITDGEVSAAHGSTHLEQVEVTVKGEDTPRLLPCTRMIGALGFTANLGPLLEWGMEITGRRYINVDTTGVTAIPGVYGAGDIVEYPGKVRLIVVGFGEAAIAINNAAVFLDPSAHLFPGHSSEESAAEPASTSA